MHRRPTHTIPKASIFRGRGLDSTKKTRLIQFSYVSIQFSEDGRSSDTPALLKRKHPDSPSSVSGDNEALDDDSLVEVVPSKMAHIETPASRLPPAPSGQPKLMAGVTGVRTLDQNSFEAHHVRTAVDHLIRIGGIKANQDEESTGTSAAADEDNDDEDASEAEGAPHDDSELLRMQPLNLPLNMDPTLRFRGSQPVSMTRQNAHLIVDKPYAVSYKSDGTRYLMLIHGPDKVYMIDRGNFVYKVDKLQFPTREWLQEALAARRNGDDLPTDFMTKPGGHLVNSLIDGELVSFDNSPDRPFKFLVYDVLTMQGHPWGRCSFDIRYDVIEKYLVKPRNDAGHNQLVDFTTQSFSVRRKPFFRLDHVAGVGPYSLYNTSSAKTLDLLLLECWDNFTPSVLTPSLGEIASTVVAFFGSPTLTEFSTHAIDWWY